MQKTFKKSELEINKLPIGLALPLAASANSFFEQTTTTEEKYKTCIKNLLLTTKGERRLLPRYGSRLKTRVFEQKSENFLSLIESDVSEAFTEWLPELTLVNLELYSRNDNEHAFLIKLFYKIPIDNEVKTLEIPVS